MCKIMENPDIKSNLRGVPDLGRVFWTGLLEALAVVSHCPTEIEMTESISQHTLSCNGVYKRDHTIDIRQFSLNHESSRLLELFSIYEAVSFGQGEINFEVSDDKV